MVSARETSPLGNESFLRAATEGGGWADFHIRCVLYCLLEKRGSTRLNLALSRQSVNHGITKQQNKMTKRRNEMTES